MKIWKVGNNRVKYSDEFILGLSGIIEGLIIVLSLGHLTTDIRLIYLRKHVKKLLNKLNE